MDQWKLLRSLEKILSGLHKPHQTQKVPSLVTVGSRQSTRKAVSHRLGLLLLVHEPLHAALGWLVPYFGSG